MKIQALVPPPYQTIRFGNVALPALQANEKAGLLKEVAARVAEGDSAPVNGYMMPQGALTELWFACPNDAKVQEIKIRLKQAPGYQYDAVTDKLSQTDGKKVVVTTYSNIQTLLRA